MLPTKAAPTDGSDLTDPVLPTPVLHHKANLTHSRLNPTQSLPTLASNGHQKPENLPGLSACLLTDNCSSELHPCCFQGSGNKTSEFPIDFASHNPSPVRSVLLPQCSSGPLSFVNDGFRLNEWPVIYHQGAPVVTTEVLLCPSASRRRMAWSGTWDGYRNAGATGAGGRDRDILSSQAASWFVGPVCVVFARWPRLIHICVVPVS